MPIDKPKRPVPQFRVVRSAVISIAGLSIAIIVLITWVSLYYMLTPLSRNPKSPVILIRVRIGASQREIGELLKKKHIIRSAAGFVLASRVAGVRGHMVAGSYEVSSSMSPKEIAIEIAMGRTSNEYVTIPEGYTIRQIAARLAGRHMADEAKFVKMATTQGRQFVTNKFRAPNNNLEGYLFPDTYRIPKGTSENQIIAMMLDNFRNKVMPLGSDVFAKYPDKLDHVIILASLVEREAEVPKDRKLIAAVLENRLRDGMKLQCDATIEYALPEHKNRLYYKDLKYPSPYNTYLYAGLPPTPIANPGLASIKAALEPAKVNYLYYVAKSDGSHVFNVTYEEHKKAIAKFRGTIKQNPSNGLGNAIIN